MPKSSSTYKYKLRKQKWLLWPLAAVLTLLLYSILPYQSAFIETYYSLGLFVWFRWIWDYTIGLVPIPLVYFLVVGSLWYLISGYRKGKRLSRLLNLTRNLIILLSIFCVTFYWFWGFNYKRVDLRSTFGLKKVEMSQDALFLEYHRVTDSLNAIRTRIESMGINEMEPPHESMLREELKSLYSDIALSYSGRVRVRKIHPKGVLLRISTAGVYLPFIGEAQIDAGLHPISHSFTMMHEMSHGYGWTGEDACNFLALLGTIRSADLRMRYSGYFGYWRYLRSNAYRANKERFLCEPIHLSKEVKNDYNEIISYLDRYPDIMPVLRDLIYDTYLKSHGISEGLVNYSAIIQLAHTWRLQYGSLFNNPDSVNKQSIQRGKYRVADGRRRL